MFERFTDRARRVVVLAQEEARLLNRDHMGTEHILLGLIHEGEGVANKALESQGISLEAVREQVQEITGQGEQTPTGHIPFTPRAKKVLELSLREALQLGHNYIGTEHILLGLIREGEGVAAQVLVKLGVEFHTFRALLIDTMVQSGGNAGFGRANYEPTPAGSGELDQFGNNLTQAAFQGKLDPVIGREKEIARLMQVLSRRTKNIPVLIGEPGVGKTAVVAGLAKEIVRGEVPDNLSSMQIYVVDHESLAGDQSGGNDPGQRLQDLQRELTSLEKALVFIDDPYLFRDSESIGKGSSLAELKRFLKDVSVQAIVSMDQGDFYNFVRTDVDLANRLQPVNIDEPTVALTIEILKGLRDRYEGHHRASITDAALVAAATMANRYINDRFLPDKAIDLIDEAGAGLRIRRWIAPPDLQELNERIASVVREKESAIDGQDFEQGARLRDDERKLRAEKAKREAEWKAGDMDVFAEVDEEAIEELVAARSGIARTLLREPTTDLDDTSSQHVGAPRGNVYSLLGDQPITDATKDSLGSQSLATGIATILANSGNASPFVVAIDGGWGTGKSTLMAQIQAALADYPLIVQVEFNAWTAQGPSALEGIIKSVLLQLDANRIRRLARRLGKNRGLMRISKVAIAIVARLLGVSRLIDDIWDKTDMDAQARNELRAGVQEMLQEWSEESESIDSRKTLVIFVDDLDRCSDEVIVQVCEAVKLYLDAPGLMFVMACDMSVLARGVSAAARGGEGEGRSYLEKIVQVAYRVPSPSSEQTRELIRTYAAASGTGWLIGDTLAEILAERTNRNPRRIKRVINSFVLEHHLNPVWQSPPLGSVQLMTVVLLHHLYPSFYERILTGGPGDPIGDFLQYAEVNRRVEDPPTANDAWWSVASKVFRSHGMTAPDRFGADVAELTRAVDTLERRLPSDFPPLARDDSFVLLLRGLGDANARLAVRSQLLGKPLSSAALMDANSHAIPEIDMPGSAVGAAVEVVFAPSDQTL